ncbi:hypothetical protein J7L67_08875 [bacterium]|nr:hypothetical protein [bacterium]
MKTFLTKFLVKLFLPILANLFEEAVKLILEAISDESLSSNSKTRYVLQGLTDKIDSIEKNV